MASPPPSPNPSEKEALLTNEMESVDFASLLADLESMPHTNINARPIGKAGSRKPNDFGVCVTLKLPERLRLQKRFAVTKPDGERPTLVAATREAIKWATGELKAAGIEAPERRRRRRRSPQRPRSYSSSLSGSTVSPIPRPSPSSRRTPGYAGAVLHLLTREQWRR